MPSFSLPARRVHVLRGRKLHEVRPTRSGAPHSSRVPPSSGHLRRYDISEVAQHKLCGVQERGPRRILPLPNCPLLARSHACRILRSPWRRSELRLQKSCIRRTRFHPTMERRGKYGGPPLERPSYASNAAQGVARLQLRIAVHFLESNRFHIRLDWGCLRT